MKHKELPKEDEDEDDGAITKEELKSKKETKDKKKKTKLFKKADTTEKDPSLKFAGTGITYKAKLFGDEEVPEARGETLCQDAFSRLKLSLKSKGEHKQKIMLNISLDGIKIREDKSGELLHHHPVREISFISQDMTDSRAFGYIYGCKEMGWRVFAIKTEKNASQVILCLRELFETVLIKKKEKIEEVKKEAQKGENGSHQETAAAAAVNGKTATEKEQQHNRPEPAVADLLDLQSEMDSLQLGISHMDTSMKAAAANCVPQAELFDPFRLQNNLGPPIVELPSPFNQPNPNWEPTSPEQEEQSTDRYAAFANIDSVVSIFDRFNKPPEDEQQTTTQPKPAEEENGIPEVPSLFADLNPLGNDKPFVDKKDFFNDVKKPPKKVLKELTGDDSSGSNSTMSSSPYETVYFQEESSTPPPLLPPKRASRTHGKEDWEIPTRNPFATEILQQHQVDPNSAPAIPAKRPWVNGLENCPTPPIPTPMRKTNSSSPPFITNGGGSPLKRPPLARNSLCFEEERPPQSQSIRVPPPPAQSGSSPVHRGSIGNSIVRPRPVGRLSVSYVSSVSSTESVESLSGSPQSANRHTLRDLEDSASLSGGSDISSGGLQTSSDNSSIFIKHSDPFADDPFFTSLPKKTPVLMSATPKPLQPC